MLEITKTINLKTEPKRHFILIGYAKRSGKDTFAKYLSRYLPNSEVKKFADPMKDIVADFMRISKHRLEEEKNYENPIFDKDCNVLTNFRWLLQDFGSNKMKEYFGEDVWVNLLLKSLYSKSQYVIIPDWRFKVEYSAIAKKYGKENVTTIKVTKKDIENNDSHKSETELHNFGFDIVVFNDGTLEELEAEAEQIATVIKEKMWW